ncbi:MAG: glycoside hydrolase family 2 [Bacteroidales bacterium]|nr:glycoside hydrolase family 2 [Bacteroidales bacterium]
MNRKVIIYGLSLLFSWAVSAEVCAQRENITINHHWLFNYLPGSELDTSYFSSDPELEDWISISLPHTWFTFQTTGERHPYIKNASERLDPYWWKGLGYYKKDFVLPEIKKNERYFLEFDGVQKYCRLFVNGVYIGEHKGGYNSFSFDISQAIEKGTNSIRVAVSNLRNDPFGGIPPMSAGNFNVYGGIYRDARLIKTSDVYIPYQGNHSHEGGTFITSTVSDSSRAIIHITNYLKNDRSDVVKTRVVNTIFDPDGKKIASFDTQVTLPPGQIIDVKPRNYTISNPDLWSPGNPAVYSLKTEIYKGKKKLDAYYSTFGIRWFYWDFQTDRLWLNGAPVHIHGTNRHQEYPWLGDAIPKWLTLRDMLDIKNNLGHNFMRAAHYPNDPYLYHLTDSLGLIAVEEVPNIKPLDFGEEIQRQNLKAMIRRDRNHPSIFFWSMGNETNDAADSKWAWEEDTTRILHERKTEGFGDFVTHNHTNLDMENLLRVTVRGWYNKDVKNLEPANSKETPKSGQLAGTEEWQHKMARVDGGSIRGRIDQNIVAWLYEDHGCDRVYQNAPLKHVNYKGWVDNYRVPKYMYYLWQANYAPYPMVKIMPHFWRQRYLGTLQDFTVDSNCEKVKLEAGSKSYGYQYPGEANFHSVVFKNIPVEEKTLVATGYLNDEIVCTDTLYMAGKASRINISAEYNTLFANNADVALIWVEVVDDNNHIVLGAAPDLKWSVTGEGTLVGPNLYQSDINKNSAEEGEGYIDTPVFNIIRTTNTAGEIRITVSSEGLIPDTLSLYSSANIPPADWISEMKSALENKSIRKRQDLIGSFDVEPWISHISSNTSIEKLENNSYGQHLVKWLRGNNTRVDTSRTEFKYIVILLEDYLGKMNGEIIADDFNFIADRFNEVYSFNNQLTDLHLHKEFTEYITRFYAEGIIYKSGNFDLKKAYEIYSKYARNNSIIEFHKPKDPALEGTSEYMRTTYKTRFYTDDLMVALRQIISNYETLSDKQLNAYIEELIVLNPGLLFENEDGIGVKMEAPILVSTYEIQ